MNLEQAIHERWAAAEALCALLPAEKLRTGAARGLELPYAVLTRKAGRNVFRTSGGQALDEVILAVCVRHEEYDAGRAVVREVMAAFDNSDFSLSDGPRVVAMRRTGETAPLHDGKAWRFELEFLVQVDLPSGA